MQAALPAAPHAALPNIIRRQPLNQKMCPCARRVNDSKYGLQAGVFTHDLDKAWHAFEHMEVGGVVWNHVPSIRVDAQVRAYCRHLCTRCSCQYFKNFGALALTVCCCFRHMPQPCAFFYFFAENFEMLQSPHRCHNMDCILLRGREKLKYPYAHEHMSRCKTCGK